MVSARQVAEVGSIRFAVRNLCAGCVQNPEPDSKPHRNGSGNLTSVLYVVAPLSRADECWMSVEVPETAKLTCPVNLPSPQNLVLNFGLVKLLTVLGCFLRLCVFLDCLFSWITCSPSAWHVQSMQSCGLV